MIFSSGNGVARVDDEWFAHAAEGVVLGRRVQLCPPEELIWSKAFVLERERYDGADVAHLLREAGREIDWRRLLARFGSRWPVLFSHLTLFFFIYPDQRDVVPAGLMEELAGRLTRLTVEPEPRVCFGTLLSREQYLPDLERHGYLDARVSPHGSLTPDEVRVWTDAIDKQGNRAILPPACRASLRVVRPASGVHVELRPNRPKSIEYEFPLSSVVLIRRPHAKRSVAHRLDSRKGFRRAARRVARRNEGGRRRQRHSHE